MGSGERSRDLTDLARRGAGAGGGSLPASNEVDSPLGCNRLSMNKALLALRSEVFAESGSVGANVVSDTGVIAESSRTFVRGGDGAGRPLSSPKSSAVSVFPVNSNLLKASTSKDFLLSCIEVCGTDVSGAGGRRGAEANLPRVFQTAES